MTFQTLKTKKHSSECPKCKDKAFVFCQCFDYPVKQLSDAGIEEIARLYFGYGKHPVIPEHEEGMTLGMLALVDFAKAILRKAQENG